MSYLHIRKDCKDIFSFLALVTIGWLMAIHLNIWWGLLLFVPLVWLTITTIVYGGGDDFWLNLLSVPFVNQILCGWFVGMLLNFFTVAEIINFFKHPAFG